MDCAVSQNSEDNLSDVPQAKISGSFGSGGALPPLPPEFQTKNDKLGLKLFLLCLTTCGLSIFVFEDFRTLGAASLFVSAIVHMPFVFALIAPRSCDTADPLVALPNDMLPTYTILIPVFHEANMMTQIASSMAALKYPQYLLDILVLIEIDDPATRAAADRTNWPPSVRLLTVHAPGPQTKPRACNFGLAHARGSFIVVYDAEDQPHPNQLRDAAAIFHQAPAEVACLQAPLVIDKEKSNWLGRQFALECNLLFTRFLPVLTNVGCAVPLGGTSNHLKCDVLRNIGAWDCHNLTEDADLGIRLARHGYRTQMLQAPTFENAPHGLKIFLRQRIRWQSGHIQTISVHLRRPFQAMRSMGAANYLCFLMVLVCRLTNPVAHAFLIGYFAVPSPVFGNTSGNAFTAGMLLASVMIYMTYFILAYRGMQDEKPVTRLMYILTLPIYWLLIMLATLSALLRMVRGQMNWLKTPHQPFQRNSGEQAETDQ